MKTQLSTFTLPAHWATALINNDWSGLDETEQHEIHYWLANNDCPDFIDCGEQFFSKYNDANALAGNMAEFTAFTKIPTQ